MKNLFFVIVMLLFVSCGTNKQEELRIFNWMNYIPNSVLKKFEEEKGVRVSQEMMVTSEQMYAKFMSNVNYYDILIPSDYMVERLIREEHLQILDKELIPNFAYLFDHLKDLSYDPQSAHSIPLGWGNIGLIFDKETILPDTKRDWSILWDERYRRDMFMIDGVREAFAIAFIELGYSINTTDIDQINEAVDLLKKQKQLNLAYAGDTAEYLVNSRQGSVYAVWSTSAQHALKEMKNQIEYVIPPKTITWYDSMVIPRYTEQSDLAHEFINFIYREDIAEMIYDSLGYLIPHKVFYEKIKDQDGVYHELYPINPSQEFEIIKDFDDEMIALYLKLWNQIQSS